MGGLRSVFMPWLGGNVGSLAIPAAGGYVSFSHFWMGGTNADTAFFGNYSAGVVGRDDFAAAVAGRDDFAATVTGRDDYEATVRD
jgi:hypothetical protein